MKEPIISSPENEDQSDWLPTIDVDNTNYNSLPASTLITQSPSATQAAMSKINPSQDIPNRWFSLKASIYAGVMSPWNITHDAWAGMKYLDERYIDKDPDAASQYLKSWGDAQKQAQYAIASLPDDSFTNKYLIKDGGSLLGGMLDPITLGIGAKVHAGVEGLEGLAALSEAGRASQIAMRAAKGAISGAGTALLAGTTAAAFNPILPNHITVGQIGRQMGGWALWGGALGGIGGVLSSDDVKGINGEGNAQAKVDSRVDPEGTLVAALDENNDKYEEQNGEERDNETISKLIQKRGDVLINMSSLADQISDDPGVQEDIQNLALTPLVQLNHEKGTLGIIKEGSPEVYKKLSFLPDMIKTALYDSNAAKRVSEIADLPPAEVTPEDEEFVSKMGTHKGELQEIENSPRGNSVNSVHLNARKEHLRDLIANPPDNKFQSDYLPQLNKAALQLSKINDSIALLNNKKEIFNTSREAGRPTFVSNATATLEGENSATGHPDSGKIIDQKLNEDDPGNVKPAEEEFESAMEKRIKDLQESGKLTPEDVELLESVKALKAGDKNETKLLNAAIKCIVGDE